MTERIRHSMSPIVLGSVIVTVACALLLSTAGSAIAGPLRVGERLPAAELRDWRGNTVSLASQPGTVVVIDFWASWCAVCRHTLPALNELARRYPASQVQVLAINIDKSHAAAERFLQEFVPSVAVTLLQDSDGAFMSRIGAEGMPALYVVDRTGVVRMVQVGEHDNWLDSVDRAVTTAMAPPPQPPNT